MQKEFVEQFQELLKNYYDSLPKNPTGVYTGQDYWSPTFNGFVAYVFTLKLE